jgi:hypothetical protein
VAVEIEKDLALAMQPKTKFGRFAYTHTLIKAGTDLMGKAEAALHRSALARARQFRDGLVVAMLGYHPIRPKNFAALELGSTFKRVLRLAFCELKRNAASGVDGMTWQDYEADLELRLADLHA